MEQIKSLRLIAVTAFLSITLSALQGQGSAADPPTLNWSGNFSVTTNGFSLIPTFSLGKPAALAVMSVGGERFSFDPQFRFDLEGLKPWSFIFIWRYKLVKSDRWLIRPGLHMPAIAFSQKTFESDGISLERMVPSRYLTPEWTTSYRLTEQISLGVYYLYGLGLEKEGQTRHTHFLSLRAGFNRIGLPGGLHFSWDPQIYYLNLDRQDGFFIAHSLSLGHRKVPLSISTMMNKALTTEIRTRDFDWNISLVYLFSHQFVRK